MKERYNNIDGLRAFGCVAIMCWHIYANSDYMLPTVLSKNLIPSFDYLVFLFMIISGFGMFNGYYQKFIDGKQDVVAFYERRYTKLVPFFICLLLLNVVIDHSLASVIEGLTEATMLFGLLPNNALSAIGVAWTMGVIFVFYLLFPFFVFCFKTKKRAWFTMAVSLFITFAMENYFLSDAFGTAQISPRHTFLDCMPFFVVGGLLYLYRKPICNAVGRLKVIYTLICVALTVVYYFIPEVICGINLHTFTLLILYTLWMVYAIGVGNKLMTCKPISALSGISMEYYLAHMVVFRIVQKILPDNFMGTGLIAYIVRCVIIFVGLVAAIAVYKYLAKLLSAEINKRRKQVS